MQSVLLGGVGALVVTALAGRALGRVMRGHSAALYWTSNALILIVAMALVACSTVAASDLLFGLGLGLGFGGLAGLRYGWRGLFTLPSR